jgi:hypothetical protein
MPDHAIAHVEGVVTDPSMRFIRRPEAARYLKDKYGFGASRTLAKGVVTGDTPVFHKAGRIVLYTREALDAWALAKISGPLKSSSEAARLFRSRAVIHVTAFSGTWFDGRSFSFSARHCLPRRALARATNKAQAFSCKQSIAEKPF